MAVEVGVPRREPRNQFRDGRVFIGPVIASAGQDLCQDQIERLKSAGCEKVFTEKVSSVDTRPKLEMAIEFVRDGDALVITKLDRFARSVVNLWELIQQVEKKGAGLIILDFGGNTIDTRTAAGRAMLNMFGTMAQFEREVMLERQRVGIARAKAEGKYKGRKPTARNSGRGWRHQGRDRAASWYASSERLSDSRRLERRACPQHAPNEQGQVEHCA